MSGAGRPYGAGVDRRQWLGRGGVALFATVIAVSRGHAAQVKVSKADAAFQFAPKGDQRCGLCASFAPVGDPSAVGACKLVDGPIPPMGWCQLFANR